MNVKDSMSILGACLVGILVGFQIVTIPMKIVELGKERCSYISTPYDEHDWPQFSNVETSYI